MIGIRTATDADAEAIARIVNTAFLAERFFIERDRTDPETVRGLMRKGRFLVEDEDDRGEIVGCIYAESRGERGYFGMLSIEPALQGKGLGHRLVDAVEKWFRNSGCKFSDMKIVNVRTELYDLYTRWGYKETGTAVYDDPTPTKIPVHFVLMSKPL